MKIGELKKIIKQIVLSKDHIPAMIWSPPGLGKSSAVKQVADELGWQFIDLRLSLLNPVDLRGLPYINKETHKAEWLEPDFLPNGNHEKNGILFLDEINLAPASVMAAGYQLILDRKLGNYVLPKGWKILAAGNRAEDQANVTKFPAPLANRFIHFDLDSQNIVDEWRKWAIGAGISEQVVSFLGKMPQHIFQMPKAGEKSFPTPRSWGNASKLNLLGLDIAPAVGEGVSAEFRAFQSVYMKLPDVDAILSGKEKSVPKELDVLWALTTSLIYRTEEKHLEYLFPYIARMPKEFEVLTVLGVTAKSEEMELLTLKSPEYADWAKRNKDLGNDFE